MAIKSSATAFSREFLLALASQWPSELNWLFGILNFAMLGKLLTGSSDLAFLFECIETFRGLKKWVFVKTWW